MHFILTLLLAASASASTCKSPLVTKEWRQPITNEALQSVLVSAAENPITLDGQYNRDLRRTTKFLGASGKVVLTASLKKAEDIRMQNGISLNNPSRFFVGLVATDSAGRMLGRVALEHDRSYVTSNRFGDDVVPGARTVRFSKTLTINGELGELVALVHQNVDGFSVNWNNPSDNPLRYNWHNKDITLKWIPRAQAAKEPIQPSLENVIKMSAVEPVVLPVSGSRRMEDRSGPTFEKGMIHPNGKEGIVRANFAFKGAPQGIYGMGNFNLELRYVTQSGNESMPIILRYDHELDREWYSNVSFSRDVQFSADVTVGNRTRKLIAHVRQSLDPHGWPASVELHPKPRRLTTWYNQRVELTWGEAK